MLTIYTDGASSGNPGPMGIGVAMWKDGKLVKELSEYIGRGTNNFAEYTAVLRALEEAKKLGEHAITLKSDSELVIKQLNGEYKIKNKELKQLKHKVELLASSLSISFEHIPREHNATADKLSKQAVKGHLK